MKTILKIVACAILLVGCTTKPTVQEADWNMQTMYSALPQENVFYAGTQDSLEKLLNHGTGVIFLGFPECPWCQSYVPVLNEEAEQADVRILYYNIYTDKSEDRVFYDKIAQVIDEKNAEITHYDNDGNMVIYMPLVLFVNDGEIIAFDDESCDLDSDEIKPEVYWTQDKLDALHTRLAQYLQETKKNQDAGNAEGCGVKIEPTCNEENE